MDGFDAEQQELIRSLLKKRDELMRMQEAIHRLQAMDVPRLEPASSPEEPEEEEEYEEEEEAEEEEEEVEVVERERRTEAEEEEGKGRKSRAKVATRQLWKEVRRMAWKGVGRRRI